jgi:hypothetical protein
MADSNTEAVQVLISINGYSLTVRNDKKNVVSLKVARTIGDSADTFTLQLFDETAWKIESFLYGTKGASISIQYGATADWEEGNYRTFTGTILKYSSSFVGAATLLSLSGVVSSDTGNAQYWFKNQTIQWVDTNIQLPTGKTESTFDSTSAQQRNECAIDGKWLVAGLGPNGAGDQGYNDAGTSAGGYADYICARIEWLPMDKSGNYLTGDFLESDVSSYDRRVLINPSNIFRRIIRKYNGEINGGNGSNSAGYGHFILGDVDESLWVSPGSESMTQSNITAAEFIVNTLCKIAVKDGGTSAGFKYYIDNQGRHCFKAIDYNSVDSQLVTIHAGYYTKSSNVISFSLDEIGAMIIAGSDTDEQGYLLQSSSSIDNITTDVITSDLSSVEGNYVSSTSNSSNSSNSSSTDNPNWFLTKTSSSYIAASSTKSILDAKIVSKMDEIKKLTLTATMVVWGKYNNMYEPGKYVDVVVYTPDGKTHYSTGKYYITKAEDSITSDGYTSSLSLIKNTDSSKEASKIKGSTVAVQRQDINVDSTQSNENNAGSTTDSINTDISSIPDGLGNVHTYMNWNTVTSVSSKQHKLRTLAEKNGSLDLTGPTSGSESAGYYTIKSKDGTIYYMIACTSTFGNVGDYVTFHQKNGTEIKGCIGDIKNQSDNGCTKWGHNNGTCIVEFITSWSSWHLNPGRLENHPEFNSTIDSANNSGNNYFNEYNG